MNYQKKLTLGVLALIVLQGSAHAQINPDLFSCPTSEYTLVHQTNAPVRTTIQLDRDATITITGHSRHFGARNDPYVIQQLYYKGNKCAGGNEKNYWKRGRDQNFTLSCTRNYVAGEIVEISYNSAGQRNQPQENNLRVSCTFIRD